MTSRHAACRRCCQGHRRYRDWLQDQRRSTRPRWIATSGADLRMDHSAGAAVSQLSKPQRHQRCGPRFGWSGSADVRPTTLAWLNSPPAPSHGVPRGVRLRRAERMLPLRSLLRTGCPATLGGSAWRCASARYESSGDWRDVRREGGLCSAGMTMTQRAKTAKRATEQPQRSGQRNRRHDTRRCADRMTASHRRRRWPSL